VCAQYKYLISYTIYNINAQQFILVTQTSNTLGLGVNVLFSRLTKLLHFDHRKTHLTLKGKTMHRPCQVWLTEPN